MKRAKPAPLALLDEIRAENSVQGPNCSLWGFMGTLSEEERGAVWAAISDRTIQTSAIGRWLKKRGYTRTAQVIDRHRVHGCRTCKVTA